MPAAALKFGDPHRAERIWLTSCPKGVPADIDVAQFTSLVALMEESFKKYAARTAYHFMGKDVTFAQTDSLSQAFAVYLQGLALAKGDRGAAMMPNVPQYPVVVAVILRAGLVNYVVRNQKKWVPAFNLPGAVRFNSALAKGSSGAFKKAGDWR